MRCVHSHRDAGEQTAGELVEFQHTPSRIDHEGRVFGRVQRRLQAEHLGRILDGHEREATILVRHMQDAYMRHAQLIRNSDHHRRRIAVRTIDEILDDVGIRKLQCFQQTTAFQG